LLRFFQRSGLPKEVLAKVWDLANSQRAGFLDRLAFHKAMDLISMAQQGGEISKELYIAALDRGVPLPHMEGLEGLGVSSSNGEFAAGAGGAVGGVASSSSGFESYPAVPPPVVMPQSQGASGSGGQASPGKVCALLGYKEL
jgi:EH domain-containing protein 1